jgi:hypothetical protein
VTSSDKTKINLSGKPGWKRCALNPDLAESRPADTTKSALFLRSTCTQQ